MDTHSLTGYVDDEILDAQDSVFWGGHTIPVYIP